ncbi:MAG TPA: glycosyltransferase, partial [Segetibacter sp.]
MQITFWLCLFIVFYTFVGYGIVLFFLVRIKRLLKGKAEKRIKVTNLPSLTVIVAAYNEVNIIEEKIQNTLQLPYPPERISYIFVTDGSTDGTPQKVSRHEGIRLMHSPERKGKIAAIHRAMKEVSSDVVVFTDANTHLNKDALINIARHFSDNHVGAVSGEKRVMISEMSDATAGEGFYWKYES